jgi:hypothetical protein
MNYQMPLAASLLLSAAVGCQRGPAPHQAAQPREAPTAGVDKGEPLAEAPVGARNDEAWGRLDFDIQAVYPDQSPTEAAPWHADGGDWTFFDCRVAAHPPVDFLVGVRRKGKGAEVSWGEATLFVADRAAGQRFLDAFGKAFHQKAPKPKSPRPLRPLRFGTAILASNARRAPDGGFKGMGGGWQATKWFPELEGYSAEVFFNYDLGQRKGEFTEKDPDYREDLVGVLAAALRDGPRPERTPQTDPNLTDAGPHIGDTVLLCAKPGPYVFGPGAKKVVYVEGDREGPSVVYAIAPENPGEKVELARVEKMVQSITCLTPDATRLLIRESIPTQPGVWSGDDPERLWWIDGAAKQRQALQGPWGDKLLSLGDIPVSPDGRYVVIGSWKPAADRGNYAVLHILDRQTGKTQTIDIPNKSLEHVGWDGDGQELRVVFTEGHRWDKEAKRRWFQADPATGAYMPVNPPPKVEDPAQRVSPDGSLVAGLLGKEKLTVTEVKSGKRQVFAFHEDDQRYVEEGCFEWVSPRYLKLALGKLSFLDVRTMKMNYPAAKGDERTGYTFSPDFRWALLERVDKGLYLGRVVGAEEDR